MGSLRPDPTSRIHPKPEPSATTSLSIDPERNARWSAIAAELPGRTDNEIKNVWHTHLKKRAEKKHVTPEIKGLKTDQELVDSSNLAAGSDQTEERRPISPQQCSSDTSSVTTGDIDIRNNMCMKMELSDDFPEMDENFWSEVLFADNPSIAGDYSGIATEPQLQFPFSPLVIEGEQVHATNSNMYDSTEYWHNLFTRAGESLELPEI